MRYRIMHSSLRVRLLIVNAIVLSVFFTALAIIASQTFDYYLQENARERLKLHTYTLLSVAELNNGKLHLPIYLREQRFNEPHSGLYGLVINAAGDTVWHSSSAQTLAIKKLAALSRGEWSYERFSSDGGESMIMMKYGVSWGLDKNLAPVYTFVVMERLRPLREQMQGYRLVVFIVLIVLLTALLALESLILHWGLNPLRNLTKELQQLESGDASQLDEEQPRELQRLVANLNLLLANEREQRQRYRNTMADLTHSLKTPLAVLKGLESSRNKNTKDETFDCIDEQVSRMNSIVAHQLQRTVIGHATFEKNWLKLSPYVDSTLQALSKVYAEKGVSVRRNVGSDLYFCGDENDLLDILGNLLDNAFKQCVAQVVLTCCERKEKKDKFLLIQVEDDGSGVPEGSRQEILKRGVRLDSRALGHGVGLATVMTIIEGYRGTLEIERSPMGGALFRVLLPLA